MVLKSLDFVHVYCVKEISLILISFSSGEVKKKKEKREELITSSD